MPARVRLILPGLFVMPLMASSGLCADQADRPLFLPTDDVAVIYRFDGVAPNLPRKLQITYTAKGARVRIDYFRFLAVPGVGRNVLPLLAYLTLPTW
jgi:hypothetical protein